MEQPKITAPPAYASCLPKFAQSPKHGQGNRTADFLQLFTGNEGANPRIEGMSFLISDLRVNQQGQSVGTRLGFFVITWAILASATGCFRQKSDDPADDAPVQKISPKVAPEKGPPPPVVATGRKPGPDEIKALELLRTGKQSEAEHYVHEKISRDPELLRLIVLVAARDPASEQLIAANAKRFRDNQWLLFLSAACTRSRFDVEQAYPRFAAVAAIDPATPEGQCARHMLALDSQQLRADGTNQLNLEFGKFSRLVESHAENVVIRWMLAVGCRTWNLDELGAVHYAEILKKWQPGPVLVHQTYANILDQLRRYDEALVERRKAVQMEPAGWSYDGLGNTLSHMKRFKEAYAAHAEAIRLDPQASYWRNWAGSLEREGRFDEAIAKCEQAVADDPTEWRALWVWAECLQLQGKNSEALKKCRAALAVAPNEAGLLALAAELEKATGKLPQR